MFSGTLVPSTKLMKSVVSLRYDFCCCAIGWSSLSTKRKQKGMRLLQGVHLPYADSHFQILECLCLVERPQKHQYCMASPVEDELHLSVRHNSFCSRYILLLTGCATTCNCNNCGISSETVVVISLSQPFAYHEFSGKLKTVLLASF